MRLTIWCKHYRAMSDHKTCAAGIAYDTLDGHGKPGFFDKCPCFWKRGKGADQPCSCPSAAYPTDAEIAAEEAESCASMERIGKARQAIVAHLGGPWKRGTPGASGVIDCPACGGKQTLRFTRAGYNGHIHAGCTTTDCVRWME
jgi:hypothetical protein